MRNAILSAILVCFATRPNAASANPNPNMFEFEALESLALQNYQRGDYAHTLAIYQSYENSLNRQTRFAKLQPDLLYNQIIASYRNESYAMAAAYLTQFNLVTPTPDSEKALHEVRMLIEHIIYQSNPRLRFVRGIDPDYDLWTDYHQYTQAQLQGVLFVAWAVLFALIITLYCLWNFRKSKTLFLIFFLFAAATLTFLGVFSYQRIKCNYMTFGVITNADKIRVEPGDYAALVKDDGFIPGLVVRVIQRVPGWLFVRRVDHVYGWIAERDLYILHGKDEVKFELPKEP